jgi:hypothetical protein
MFPIVATMDMDAMAIIQVQEGKNLVEDILLDGGFGVNIITKDLRKNYDFPYPN